MLLKALIVRSTTQKDEKTFLRPRKSSDLYGQRTGKVAHLSPDGTDRLIALATGRDVAHGQGGNQGKHLVF